MIKEILISVASGVILLSLPYIIKFYKKLLQNWYNYIGLNIYSNKPYNSFPKYCFNYFLHKYKDRN